MKRLRNILLASIFLIIILSRIFVGEVCNVSSPSMEPTILSGDYLWIDKMTYGARFPQRWADIPIINIFTWIKPLRIADQRNNWRYRRVWGIKEPQCGDLIVFNSPENNNTLLVKRITRIYDAGAGFAGKRDNYYYVEGDNKENSRDSRAFGYISESAIIGKINLALFSVESSDAGRTLRKKRFFKTIN